MARDSRHPCARCGVRTTAEFCADCVFTAEVDPLTADMVTGGLTAREYAARARERGAPDRAFWAAISQATGRKGEWQRRKARQREKAT